jgi:hypothetical protein
MVVAVQFRGIELRMTGGKRLVGLKIPPELLTEWEIEDLEEAIKEGVLRARIVADYLASRTVADLTGIRRTLDQAKHLSSDDTKHHERAMLVPELNAGINFLLQKRSWTPEDLADRAEVDFGILEDLLTGQYGPFEAIKGEKTLCEVMDLAAPIARAFGVSPQQLWNVGRAKIAADKRARRNQLKRILNGFKLNKRGRKRGAKPPDLRLGSLRASGVMAEKELEMHFKVENARELIHCGREWLPRPERAWKDERNCGCLLGPNGEILRRSLDSEEFKEFMRLDRRAAADPESITQEELEWMRELLGIPTLEVGSKA